MRPYRPNPNPQGLSRHHADGPTQKRNRVERAKSHIKQETAVERRARKREEAEARNAVTPAARRKRARLGRHDA